MAENRLLDQRGGVEPRSELWGHPKGLYVLFFTELWERFSYYGMRAILVLYMISSATGENAGLGWLEGNALALYGWYTMLVYLMSIPGGILADKFIGQKKSVLIGGLILVAGHGILAFDQVWAFYTGLLLIVIGVGGLKPNISTMVGGLYAPGDERRDSGFTIFYIGINVGAFLASLIVGFVGETVGWHYGFGLAGIGMLVGQLVFMMGQKHLKGVGEAPSKVSGPPTSVVEADKNTSLGALFGNLFKSPLQLGITAAIAVGGVIFGFTSFEGYEKGAYAALFLFLAACAGLLMMIYKDVNKIEKDRFVVLLLSFLIVIVFWGAFEQAGGLMNIYTAQKIDRLVSISVLDIVFYGAAAFLFLRGILYLVRKNSIGWLISGLGVLTGVGYILLKQYKLTDPYEIPASVFQSVNPLFIMIFGTVVASFWLWWRHRGKESSSLFKMAWGTIIMGVGFIFMAIASTQADNEVGAKGMLILIILAYLFHTLGELSASPVALSFITKLAPIKYVSIMMGFYFAATGLGNKVAGTIGEISQPEPVQVELAAAADLSPYVADSIVNKGGAFEIVTELQREGNTVQLVKDGQDISSLVNIEQEDAQLLRERAEGLDEAVPTAILRFKHPNAQTDEEEAESSEPVDPDEYVANVEIFEAQNRLEFRTFMTIFGFTVAFGILLLLFLKKLKRLTHGAEDKEGKSHEEQETYEIADKQDKDKLQPGEEEHDVDPHPDSPDDPDRPRQ